MPVSGMNHFTIITDDVPATEAFYGELLGLRPGWRPAFAFPGLWLYCGDVPILHVVGRDSLPEQRTGVIDHLAFTASGLAGYQADLEARGIAYDLRRLPGGGQWQMFFHDPNGARVELDFDAAETPKAG
ncbi:MAG: VOC family protein [Rhodospirillales bacterium]|jgi:catechol 2,3-dioxygenase-like lactoylglutathione lyase family enzyme